MTKNTPKLAIAYAAIVECQRSAGIAAFIDTDHTVDLVAAATAGINIANLLVSQPDNPVQASEIAETLARSGAVDLIVLVWSGSPTRKLDRAPFVEPALRTGTAVLVIPGKS